MAFILRSAKCMINQERWDKEKLQAKQNRKSVCSINNTSLVPQGLTKQPRKFHRVIIMSSMGENNLLSLGVCNPYDGEGECRHITLQWQWTCRHKSLNDEM